MHIRCIFGFALFGLELIGRSCHDGNAKQAHEADFGPKRILLVLLTASWCNIKVTAKLNSAGLAKAIESDKRIPVVTFESQNRNLQNDHTNTGRDHKERRELRHVCPAGQKFTSQANHATPGIGIVFC